MRASPVRGPQPAAHRPQRRRGEYAGSTIPFSYSGSLGSPVAWRRRRPSLRPGSRSPARAQERGQRRSNAGPQQESEQEVPLDLHVQYLRGAPRLGCRDVDQLVHVRRVLDGHAHRPRPITADEPDRIHLRDGPSYSRSSLKLMTMPSTSLMCSYLYTWPRPTTAHLQRPPVDDLTTGADPGPVQGVEVLALPAAGGTGAASISPPATHPHPGTRRRGSALRAGRVQLLCIHGHIIHGPGMSFAGVVGHAAARFAEAVDKPSHRPTVGEPHTARCTACRQYCIRHPPLQRNVAFNASVIASICRQPPGKTPFS